MKLPYKPTIKPSVEVTKLIDNGYPIPTSAWRIILEDYLAEFEYDHRDDKFWLASTVRFLLENECNRIAEYEGREGTKEPSSWVEFCKDEKILLVEL